MGKMIRFFLWGIISLIFVSCKSKDNYGDFTSNADGGEIVFVASDIAVNSLTKSRIKPLNGIGNGPLYGYGNGRFTIDATAYFEDLNIPVIRYHDVEYFNKQNRAINVSAIFPDAQADESSASSYYFEATDRLLEAAMHTGAKVIYRLGENVLNLGSATANNTPPGDFDKWARVAERIIAHYEDGWCDGYHYKGIMWEVWNEPEQIGSWAGSLESYAEFYKKVYLYIKEKHPNVDISPAHIGNKDKRERFYQYLSENDLGIEHCFAHYYASDFSSIGDLAAELEKDLKRFKLDADVIINEWNYLSSEDGWYNWAPTFYFIQTQQGAAWYAKQLIHMQAAENLAGAVYYASDMPGFWTGLYKRNSKGELVVLPAYDTFRYFGKLYNLGYEVKPDKVPEGIYVLAATDGKKEVGVMVVNDSEESKEVDVRIKDVRLDECKIQVKSKKVQAADEKIRLRLLPYEVSFVNILTQ